MYISSVKINELYSIKILNHKLMYMYKLLCGTTVLLHVENADEAPPTYIGMSQHELS